MEEILSARRSLLSSWRPCELTEGPVGPRWGGWGWDRGPREPGDRGMLLHCTISCVCVAMGLWAAALCRGGDEKRFNGGWLLINTLSLCLRYQLKPVSLWQDLKTKHHSCFCWMFCFWFLFPPNIEVESGLSCVTRLFSWSRCVLMCVETELLPHAPSSAPH